MRATTSAVPGSDGGARPTRRSPPQLGSKARAADGRRTPDRHSEAAGTGKAASHARLHVATGYRLGRDTCTPGRKKDVSRRAGARAAPPVAARGAGALVCDLRPRRRGRDGVRAPDAQFQGDSEDSRPLLEVRDHVSYAGTVEAIHGVSFEVAEGAIVAVLGSNGAGKSTLLRAISGRLPLQGGAIDSGAIEYEGRPLADLAPAEIVRRGVVQVPEGRRVFGELTVEENLRVGGVTVRGRAAPSESTRPRVRALPASGRAALTGGRTALGWRAADARDRPGLDVGAPGAALDEPSLGVAPRLVGQIAEILPRSTGKARRSFSASDRNQGSSASRLCGLRPPLACRSAARRPRRLPTSRSVATSEGFRLLCRRRRKCSCGPP
jgi:ABC-type branched-subunit amino acid transport system ATPase component